jgi:hypothetical protein
LEELEREICELAAHIAAATCRWLLLVAEFDQSGGWADWGAKSCAQWLCWRCSIGRVSAREHVRVARRLLDLPLVRQAFATGELTYCKVRAISRVAIPETEEQLVSLGLHATGAQLEKLRTALRWCSRSEHELGAADLRAPVADLPLERRRIARGRSASARRRGSTRIGGAERR